MSEIQSIFSKKSEWEEVQNVLKIFHQHQWEAVLAGGCVRDALLKIPPKDFDIAVSAPPEEVLKLFPGAKDRWKHFGVIFLPLESKTEGNQLIEITTFRKEHSYKDGRRPGVVKYTSSLQEDAERRDFTVNALFYDIKKDQVLDFVGGKKDLKARLLRTVGTPKARFEEDYLRPLRALRFAHQLNFTIESETGNAIPFFSKNLTALSKERIYSELVKMFCMAPLNQAVQVLKKYFFFEVLFPFKRKPTISQPDLFWNVPFSFYKEAAFTWAVFGLPYFYSNPKEMEDFLLSLKAPLKVATKSRQYIKGVKILFESSSFVEKLKVFSLGKDQIQELAKHFGKASHFSLKQIEKLSKEFQIRSSDNQLPSPLIQGEDLLKAGFSPGKHLGDMLKKAYNYQLEKNLHKKEDILKIFKEKS